MGPCRRSMSHDRADGSTGFSFRRGIQLRLFGRSDLRSGQLGCQRVILWLSDICRTLAALLEWRRSNRKWVVGRSCSFVGRKPFWEPELKNIKKKNKKEEKNSTWTKKLRAPPASYFKCLTTKPSNRPTSRQDERPTGCNTALCRSDRRDSGCNKCTARCRPAGVSLRQRDTSARTTKDLFSKVYSTFAFKFVLFTVWLKQIPHM